MRASVWLAAIAHSRPLIAAQCAAAFESAAVDVDGTVHLNRGALATCPTYIPPGMTHRLENPGKTALEIIEVQSGCYLGEDDIVRFDDQYGRVQAQLTETHTRTRSASSSLTISSAS